MGANIITEERKEQAENGGHLIGKLIRKGRRSFKCKFIYGIQKAAINLWVEIHCGYALCPCIKSDEKKPQFFGALVPVHSSVRCNH